MAQGGTLSNQFLSEEEIEIFINILGKNGQIDHLISEQSDQ